MHTLTVLAISAILVLSASAASVDKRTISAPTQLCIDDLNNVASRYEVLKYNVNEFTAATGWAGFLALNQRIETVLIQLNQTSISCGAISGTVSAEEADAINLADSKINSQAIPCLASFIIKKPEFDKIPLITNVTIGRIGQLDQKTDALNTCLVSKIPATHLEALNGYIAEIDGQFEKFKVAYGTK